MLYDIPLRQEDGILWANPYKSPLEEFEVRRAGNVSVEEYADASEYGKPDFAFVLEGDLEPHEDVFVDPSGVLHVVGDSDSAS